jgi:pimeloyl-ACP methyl ester carboxylesterase
MATYVLVGGAWLGAWVWKSVVRALRAHGHDVYPLSLTGMGERVHLARPETDLATHITDVVNLIRYEDLTDVVLVGHSYAGWVVTGAADRVPTALSSLVYCDSAPGPNGLALLDIQSPQGQAELRRIVATDGEGWYLPFPGFPGLGEASSITGLDAAAQDLMLRKAAPQPLRTWTQPLQLTQTEPPTYRRAAILCEDGQRLLDSGVMAPFLSGTGWHILKLDTGHWPMLSKPEELSRLLHQLA